MSQPHKLEEIRARLLHDGYEEDAVSAALLFLIDKGKTSLSLARKVAWRRVIDERRRIKVRKRAQTALMSQVQEGRQLERVIAREELERLGPVFVNPELPEENDDGGSEL